MRGSIRHDELDSCCLGGMFQQHLFDQDAAQAMRDKNDLAMLPDLVMLEMRPEDVGQLYARHTSIRCRRGILRNFNVGVSKVRIRPNHIGPVSAIRSSPGL